MAAKSIILQVVTRIVKRTTSTWDDIFHEQKVFTRLSHFAPVLVIWFMEGLGAFAAVVSLIFKDAILGLVASIQLSGHNMLKVGDWITISSRGVDGVTEDIKTILGTN
jgi:hypothetical protein